MIEPMNTLRAFFIFTSFIFPPSASSAAEPTYEDVIMCAAAYRIAVKRLPNLFEEIGVYIAAFDLVAITKMNPRLLEYKGEDLDFLLSREYMKYGEDLGKIGKILENESTEQIRYIVSGCAEYEAMALEVFDLIDSRLDQR